MEETQSQVTISELIFSRQISVCCLGCGTKAAAVK